MDRRELETETLDSESRRVAELLRGLKRVEAPSNFEFGVRARIANGAPETRTSLLPVFKVAAPLALMLIVATIVVLYNFSPAERPIVDVVNPPVSETRATTEPPEVSNNSEPVSESLAPSEPEVAISNPPTSRVIRAGINRASSRNSNSERSPAGASRDDAVRQANTINPPEFRTGITNTSPNAQTGIPIREVLRTLGVSAEPEDGGWKVTSTAELSVARKAGLQNGDIIEAIDGQALSTATSLKGTGGKSLRVRREGKQIVLELRN